MLVNPWSEKNDAKQEKPQITLLYYNTRETLFGENLSPGETLGVKVRYTGAIVFSKSSETLTKCKSLLK